MATSIWDLQKCQSFGLSGSGTVFLQDHVDPVSGNAVDRLRSDAQVSHAALPRLALQPLGGAVP